MNVSKTTKFAVIEYVELLDPNDRFNYENNLLYPSEGEIKYYTKEQLLRYFVVSDFKSPRPKGIVLRCDGKKWISTDKLCEKLQILPCIPKTSVIKIGRGSNYICYKSKNNKVFLSDKSINVHFIDSRQDVYYNRFLSKYNRVGVVRLGDHHILCCNSNDDYKVYIMNEDNLEKYSEYSFINFMIEEDNTMSVISEDCEDDLRYLVWNEILYRFEILHDINISQPYYTKCILEY